jgi:hypothetical protein
VFIDREMDVYTYHLYARVRLVPYPGDVNPETAVMKSEGHGREKPGATFSRVCFSSNKSTPSVESTVRPNGTDTSRY